jgi:hypothetical protein
MLFDNASRAFVVAQSDELRMPAMMAFSLLQELDLSREFSTTCFQSISLWIRVPYDSVRGARGQNPRGPIIILCDSDHWKSQTHAFYAFGV